MIYQFFGTDDINVVMQIINEISYALLEAYNPHMIEEPDYYIPSYDEIWAAFAPYGYDVTQEIYDIMVMDTYPTDDDLMMLM